MDRDPADPEAGGPVDEKMIAIRRRAANFRREQEMHGYVALYSEEDREYLLDRIAELERALAEARWERDEWREELAWVHESEGYDSTAKAIRDGRYQRHVLARGRAALGRGGGG